MTEDHHVWETPVDLFCTEAMRTMADVFEAGIVLSHADIHTMGLIPVGGLEIRGVRPTTFWGIPRGTADEPSHAEACPTCQHQATPAETTLMDEDLPF
jgi:hypothetical protein